MPDNLFSLLSTPAAHYLQQWTRIDQATSVLAHIAEFGLRAPNADWNAQQVEFHKTLTESDVFAYESID